MKRSRRDFDPRGKPVCSLTYKFKDGTQIVTDGPGCCYNYWYRTEDGVDHLFYSTESCPEPWQDEVVVEVWNETECPWLVERDAPKDRARK